VLFRSRAVAPFAVNPGQVTVTFSRSTTVFSTCATLSGSHLDMQPGLPVTFTVSGRLQPSFDACGDRYTVRQLRVSMTSGNVLALQTGNGFIPDVAVTYDVVP